MKRRHQLLSALFLPAVLAVAAPGCSDDEQICAAPLASCGTVCADVRFDPGNCGACGVTCGAGQVCSAGVCAATCGEGLEECDGRCVDTAFDPNNCGSCGNMCAAGLFCSEGACGSACGGGTIACGDLCVDTSTDEANCGGCGMACGSGEQCVDAECVLGCDTGQTLCDGACVDVLTDEMNCGGCGTVCGGSQVCVIGSCEDVDALGLVLTTAYNNRISQDLYAVLDYTLEAVKVNAVTFETDTVVAFEKTPAGGVVFIAAQDTEGQFELYHAPSPGAAQVKLNAPLIADGDVNNFVISADGTRVLYGADQEADEVYDLYAVDIANPGTATKVNPPLDANEDVTPIVALSADGSTVAYVADHETDGIDDVFVVDLASPGVATLMDASVVADVTALDMNSDGTAIVYRAGQDFGNWQELYHVAVSNPGVATKVNPGGDGGEGAPVGEVDEFKITHDGTRVVMIVNRGFASEELAMATLSTSPNPVRLSATDGTDGHVDPGFVISSDDSVVYYIEHPDTSERLVYAADLNAPGMASLVSEPSDQGDDVEDFVLSADDGTLVYRRVDGGEGLALFQVDVANPGVATRLTTDAPDVYVSEAYAVTADGSRVLHASDLVSDGVLRAHLSSVEVPGVSITVGPALRHVPSDTFDVQVSGADERGYFISDGDVLYRQELYRVDAGTPNEVTRMNAPLGPGEDVRRVRVSADGSTIVYQAVVAGFEELFLVDAATPGTSTKVTPPAAAGRVSNFAVSDDGSTIVYTADQETPGVHEIYAVSAAALGVATKLNQALSVAFDGGVVDDFSVSPDGAMVFYRVDPDGVGVPDLFSVAVATPGVATHLNQGTSNGTMSFAVSHDGASVAYLAQDTLNDAELFVVSLAAPATATKLNAPLLTNRDVVDFQWSADDSFVVFRADDATDDVIELFRVNIGTPGTNIAVSSPMITGQVLEFRISPDDATVAYRSDHESGRQALYIADLSSPGTATRAHPLQVFAFLQVTSGFSYTSDSARVVYRGTLRNPSVNELYVTSVTSPGTLNPLTPTALSAPGVQSWGLTESDQALFLDSIFYYEFAAFTASPTAPGPRVRLSPFVGPNDVDAVATLK